MCLVADSVDSDQYVNGSIDTAHLANTAVTGAKIADNAINNAKIADNAVRTAEIQNAAVTNAKLAANSVDSDQYVDGSIDTAHLSADAVDGTKIADAAIASEHVAPTVVSGLTLATVDDIADDSIILLSNSGGTSLLKLTAAVLKEWINTETVVTYRLYQVWAPPQAGGVAAGAALFTAEFFLDEDNPGANSDDPDGIITLGTFSGFSRTLGFALLATEEDPTTFVTHPAPGPDSIASLIKADATIDIHGKTYNVWTQNSASPSNTGGTTWKFGYM